MRFRIRRCDLDVLDRAKGGGLQRHIGQIATKDACRCLHQAWQPRAVAPALEIVDVKNRR